MADQPLRCVDGAWVLGARHPFPTDPAVRRRGQGELVPCNQLFCDACRTPVKHMDGVQIAASTPRHLSALYDSLDPDDWLDLVELSEEYRLYFCRCCWYSTAGGTPAAHLDTKFIDHWRCHGHPPA